MNKLDLQASTSQDCSEPTIDNTIELTGEYFKDILIDRKKLKQIQKEEFSLTNHSGFKLNILEKLGIKPRKHYLFYGLNIQERALENTLTSNKVIIPLLTKKDIQNKIQKLKPEVGNTLGWIHIGAIQILIKATFKEGLNTPIELALLDNRIKNREEACLGLLKGNLQYGKLKFTIYPRISYHINDNDFDKILSLIQDFKRTDFFHNNNRPYSITYAISYGISNSHHSDCFEIKEIIDYPYLFNDVCQKQIPSLPKIEEIESVPLRLDLQDNKPLLSSSILTPRLSFTNTGVYSNPFVKTNSMRFIKEKEDSIKNYKIDGEYFNGLKFAKVNILIDTGANGNYISHRLCENLKRHKLDNTHQYTNFNGEIHEIDEAIETMIKFGQEIIPIRLLIEHEGANDTIEIMLGLTFLEKVKPYDITSYGIKITFNGKLIYIPK